MQAPTTANTQYLRTHALPLLKRLSSVTQIQDTLTFLDQNTALNFVLLKPSFRSSQTTERVAKKIQSLYKNTVALSISAIPININSHSAGPQTTSYDVYLQGYATLTQFKEAAKNYVAELKKRIRGLIRMFYNKVRR